MSPSTRRGPGGLRRRAGAAVALTMLLSACATTLDQDDAERAADGASGPTAGASAGGAPSSGADDTEATPTAPGGTATASSSRAPGGGRPGAPGPGATDAPGSAGGPAAAGTGPTGTGSGATPSSSRPGALRTSQGVTDTTVKLGVMITDAAGLQSVKGVNLGDNKVEAQAAIDWANARGGVAGRKIVPVFAEFSAASDNWERDYQSFCTSFTEDHKVFAVIGNTIAYSKTFAHCLAAHNTPLINSAGGVQDRTGVAALNPFLYTPGSFELSRMTASYVDGLHARGFFGSGAKIGLIRVDDAPFARATEQVLEPRLAGLGLKIAQQAVVTANESLGNTASQMPNVVLRFQQSGINRVLVLDNGTLAISFSIAASSQGYHPRLGLNSMNNPVLMQQNLPAESLAGAVGVGWQPSGDVDGQHDPVRNGPARTCDEINARAGQGGVSRTGVWVQRMYCDGIFFLQAALARPTELTPSGLAAGTARLGTSFASAMTFRTAFPGSRLDGAAVVRTFVYDTACSCFTYAGPERPTP